MALDFTDPNLVRQLFASMGKPNSPNPAMPFPPPAPMPSRNFANPNMMPPRPSFANPNMKNTNAIPPPGPSLGSPMLSPLSSMFQMPQPGMLRPQPSPMPMPGDMSPQNPSNINIGRESFAKPRFFPNPTTVSEHILEMLKDKSNNENIRYSSESGD